MSKILVIGASSFTGKHFCEYARKQGAEVLEGSLRQHAYAIDPVKYVVNFAAANVVAPSWTYPDEYMHTNVIYQREVWDDVHTGMLEKYVHISTPEVYGNTTGFVREDAPYNPSTPYAVSRAAAEMMLKCYHKQYGFPVVFTRSCNVYGPGQQLYRLIPKLIVSIKKGIKFPLEGGGHSSRAFLHVDDVCSAIWKVMTDGKPGEAYNISRASTIDIRGLAMMVCELMNVSIEDVTQEVPERPGKDAGYYLNDDKVRLLGWSDKVNLRKGIQSVIDWVNANWDQLKDQSLDYVHRP
jgi:dTDP-glucose 4,6-dehydratase